MSKFKKTDNYLISKSSDAITIGDKIKTFLDASEIIENCAPCWNSVQRVWVISRYRDACFLLRHPAVGVAEINPGLERLELRTGKKFLHLKNIIKGTPLFHNPPQHTHSKAFFKQAIASYSRIITPEVVEEIVTGLLNPIENQQEFDLIESVCDSLPNLLMARVLDLDPADIIMFKKAFGRINEAWLPSIPLRLYSEIEEVAEKVEMFLLEKIRNGYMSKENGIFGSGFLSASGYSESDLAALLFFLVGAGTENQGGLLGNALLILLSSQELAATLRRSPELINNFVEESIRLLGPVRRLSLRLALEDIKIDQVTLTKNARILFDLESIHRDPSAFDEPEQFDLSRKGPTHLGFGTGAHACLGASIARYQARILVGMILNHFQLELNCSQVEWKPYPDFRILSSLPVKMQG